MNTRGMQLQARVEELMGRVEELEKMLGKCACGEKELSSDKVQSDAESVKEMKKGPDRHQEGAHWQRVSRT